MRYSKIFHLLAACLAIGVWGCNSVPPFDLGADGPPSAPSGPKLAALIANLKCELYETANNDKVVLPRYYNDQSLVRHYVPGVPGYKPANPSRLFTLKNLFEEIEYVGVAQFQLEATSTPGAGFSLAFIHPFNPAEKLVNSLSGGMSEAAHRSITINTSVDFERLVESPLNPLWKKDPLWKQKTEAPLARFAPTYESPRGADEPSMPCGAGTELAGTLGLQEDLINHFIVADMNDVAVWPDPTKPKLTKIQPSDLKYGIDPITAVVDFNVTQSINGGPNWTLKRFIGGGSSAGLINYSRTVKDTLTLTLMPVCVRQKYYTSSEKAPYKYTPELVEGTPRWAKFLPPCSRLQEKKEGAVSNAFIINIITRGAIPLQ